MLCMEALQLQEVLAKKTEACSLPGSQSRTTVLPQEGLSVCVSYTFQSCITEALFQADTAERTRAPFLHPALTCRGEALPQVQ